MYGLISRYNADDIILYKDKKMYEIPDGIDTAKRSDDEYYQVKGGENLRIIANTLYNDARLWFIIGEFNDVISPWDELKPGMILRYPTLNRIFGDIL